MRLSSPFPTVLTLSLLALFAARADDVDDYIRAEMERQHIPGLALAVVRDGHIEKTAAYGLASFAPGRFSQKASNKNSFH